MIKLTQPARERMMAFLARQPGAAGVRFAVTSGGCSGHGYRVEIATELQGGEEALRVDDVPLVVATRDLPLLDGTLIDYQRDALREGFRFDNPNATGGCGCGESFSVA